MTKVSHDRIINKNHIPHVQEFINQSDRETFNNLSSVDKYKMSLQLDTMTPYILINHDPITQKPFLQPIMLDITKPDGTNVTMLDNMSFNTFGEYQIVASSNMLVECKLQGAAGGTNGGGLGGYSYGKITLLENQVYKIQVGQGGTAGPSDPAFGGGGNVGNLSYKGSGGGLTGIFLNSVTHSNSIMIAGAGGGGTLGVGHQGGNGGGLIGLNGMNAGNGGGGIGGSQTAGGTWLRTGGINIGYVAGSALKGGNAAANITSGYTGGGGGSGYYGGGPGSSNNTHGGTGAGGSSFLHPTLISDGITIGSLQGSRIAPNNTDADYDGMAGSATTDTAIRSPSGLCVLRII